MHQRPDEPPLVRRTHQQAESTPHRTRRPSIPVHVRIGCAWGLVVHNVVDGGDVETTRGNVRRQQNRVRGRLEPVEVLQPLALLELRVQREGGDVEQLEEWEQASDPVYGGEEYESAPGVAEQEIV